MSQAEQIIKLFGGINALARALKIKPSIVQGWKERGFVPARRQADVLMAAKDLDIPLKAKHFFPSVFKDEQDDIKKNLISDRAVAV